MRRTSRRSSGPRVTFGHGVRIGCGLILALVLAVGVGRVLVSQFEPRLVRLSRQAPWVRHDVEAERLVRTSFTAMRNLRSYRLLGWYSIEADRSGQAIRIAGGAGTQSDLVAQKAGDVFYSRVEGVEQMVRGGAVYERLAPNLPWVTVPKAEAASPQEFAGLAGLIRPDPASIFGSDVELPSPSVTRSETCDTEVCRVITSDLSSFGQAPGTATAELWVGSTDHLVHKMEIQSTSKNTHWDFQYEFSNFNSPITLEVPSAAIAVPSVRIGQTADLRGYTVTVRRVQEPDLLPPDLGQAVAVNPGGDKPPPGFHLVMADVIVQSKSATDLVTESYFGLRLQDDQGREYIAWYGVRPISDSARLGGDLASGRLAAGATAHDLLVYAIPSGSQPVRLVQRPGISGIAHLTVDLRPA